METNQPNSTAVANSKPATNPKPGALETPPVSANVLGPANNTPDSDDTNVPDSGPEPADNIPDETGAFDESREKMVTLINSLPISTPDSHILFGYGDVRITAGDLRTLFVVA
jgi:hypothetical protein